MHALTDAESNNTHIHYRYSNVNALTLNYALNNICKHIASVQAHAYRRAYVNGDTSTHTRTHSHSWDAHQQQARNRTQTDEQRKGQR